jgi:hypothetical protein
MAQTKTKVLTAHVPLPLAEKVDQMAARLERSRGWIMNRHSRLGLIKKKNVID